MRKETDLEQVKMWAAAWVVLDIEETPMLPLVVRHPFTDSSMAVYKGKDGKQEIADLLQNCETIQAWRQGLITRIMQTESALDIFIMLTKPYLLIFLQCVQPYLTQREFSVMLGDAWIRSESPNMGSQAHRDKLVAMFRAADPAILMNEKEYDQFRLLTMLLRYTAA